MIRETYITLPDPQPVEAERETLPEISRPDGDVPGVYTVTFAEPVDAERTPTIPAPPAEPAFHWPEPMSALSLRILREVAAVLAERPVEGDGKDLSWSLHGLSDGREFFRMGPGP